MMAMASYVDEIRHATENLIPLVWNEQNRLLGLEAEVAALTRIVEDNYRRAEFIAMNAEDPDDVAMASGMRWGTYFEEDKDRHDKDHERQELGQKITTHRFSVGSLCGSILQFAKQGISLCHGSLAACPDGRAIGSQFLKDLIWQGRNQSIHWEEVAPRPPVVACFDKLTHECGQSFGDFRNRNMAIDVVTLLGWRTVAEFEADMLLLS
ncbi:hypothetical protein H9Q09_05675 [Aurantimonas sp. DM33-3]|nr:hypothetical protein [Aurantimonas sp. DM33-3]